MANLKRKIARGEVTLCACGICGQEYYIKTMGHWYVCSKPSCQSKAAQYLAEDANRT